MWNFAPNHQQRFLGFVVLAEVTIPAGIVISYSFVKYNYTAGQSLTPMQADKVKNEKPKVKETTNNKDMTKRQKEQDSKERKNLIILNSPQNYILYKHYNNGFEI